MSKKAVGGIAVAAIPFSATLVPLLLLFLNYYRHDEVVNASKSIDVPVESLKNTYDFIVVGGGSAGTFIK